MRIAVVSDTHGNVPFTSAAVALIHSQQVAAVLHCGDIGSPAIVPLFAEWPTHFVFGNVDDPDKLAGATRGAGQTCHGQFGTLTLGGVQIALLHSDDRTLFDQTIASGKYDLVCYGHTHVARAERVGKTLVLNPGALFRANPRTFAVVDLPELTVRRIAVN
jgi:putative phosphoesterase